jgi:hypothetical protein
MSEPLPPSHQLNYEATSPYGNAPMLVRLAGIFNIIVGSLSLLFALIQVGVGIMAYLANSGRLGTAPATAPDPFGDAMMMGICGGAGLFNLVTGLLQIVAGISLLRKTPRAYGFGIAAVVASFAAVLGYWVVCCFVSIFPLGCAIYMLVVLCLDHCRRFLRNQPPA